MLHHIARAPVPWYSLSSSFLRAGPSKEENWLFVVARVHVRVVAARGLARIKSEVAACASATVLPVAVVAAFVEGEFHFLVLHVHRQLGFVQVPRPTAAARCRVRVVPYREADGHFVRGHLFCLGADQYAVHEPSDELALNVFDPVVVRVGPLITRVVVRISAVVHLDLIRLAPLVRVGRVEYIGPDVLVGFIIVNARAELEVDLIVFGVGQVLRVHVERRDVPVRHRGERRHIDAVIARAEDLFRIDAPTVGTVVA
mmetsp:Transcript_61204/g.167820  ORF Transcript_61204/g.167820 Transcript_61204/m.167820 type:complete len:257 (-) Transcript_61204:333-1103(-)